MNIHAGDYYDHCVAFHDRADPLKIDEDQETLYLIYLPPGYTKCILTDDALLNTPISFYFSCNTDKAYIEPSHL